MKPDAMLIISEPYSALHLSDFLERDGHRSEGQCITSHALGTGDTLRTNCTVGIQVKMTVVMGEPGR